MKYFEYAFLVTEGVKMSQDVKCAIFSQDISRAKILKYMGRSICSIAGFYTVEYSLHMKSSEKLAT